MIFDTDMIIWVQRGHKKAATYINTADDRYLSIQSYMELLQCAQSKQQHKYVKDFLNDMHFTLLPITQNIGHRAAIYIEEYSLGHGLRAGDAIIAATAIENNKSLCSSNHKHFKCIKELTFKRFMP